MKIAVSAGLSLAFTLIAVRAMWALAKAWKLRRRNFRGDSIPTGFGFAIVLVAAPVYAAMLGAGAQRTLTTAYLAAVIGFGALGLLDDIHGTRDVGGFKGHIGLLRKGRLSTGLLKALGGGVLGLALGFMISPSDPKVGIANGILIALAANTLNLLDFRPGRAVSCFWAGVLALAATHFRSQSDWQELVPVIVPAIWLTGLDRSARVMLGDAGSNVLGAALGLALACGLGLPAKLALIAVMVGVNVYSEKHSISKLIEHNRLLRGLDRLLGVR